LTDDFNKVDKNNEFNDKFEKISNEFDKISNEFDKSLNKQVESDSIIVEEPDISLSSRSGKTRMERLSEAKPQSRFSLRNSKINTNEDEVDVPMSSKSKQNKTKNKKYTLNKKQFFKFLLCTCIAFVLILGAIVTSIIVTTTPIQPDNIYSLLAENSVLYDDEGNIIDSLLTSDGLRTNVSYADLPEDLLDAFVAIEDKTFWEHKGFNIVRIFGAISESVFKGGRISGTSTITQQLARNLYLVEKKSDYSITRKIKEAYYTIVLEKQLTKEQII